MSNQRRASDLWEPDLLVSCRQEDRYRPQVNSLAPEGSPKECLQAKAISQAPESCATMPPLLDTKAIPRSEAMNP